MEKYIMVLDQGTTNSRCIIFDKNREIVSNSQRMINQIYPKSDWVEQNPMEIWSTQLSVATEAIAKIGASFRNIDSVGITNQRETVILWDKNTGKPIYNAIVWQCRRTATYCDELKEKGYESIIKAKTGLMIDPYFSASKISWILENVDGARTMAENGDILFGTVDCWILWNLTKGKEHKTDITNASRTMLFNIYTLEWDDELLEMFNIPKSILPLVNQSASEFGKTSKEFFGGELTIGGIAGDQQAALFGQNCREKGSIKNTYGTGCFILMNTGETPIVSENGLLTTIAIAIDGKINYALEGSVFIAGAAIQWLQDGLKLIDDVSFAEMYAERETDSNGVYFVPAFVGLGAPYWDPYARGSVFGLTRSTTKGHFIRATIESLAYQSLDIMRVMEKDSKLKCEYIRVDGKASSNDFLLQFQADITNAKVVRPKIIESTALGAALLAGHTTKFYDLSNLNCSDNKIDSQFVPSFTENKRNDLIKGWNEAIKRSSGWINYK